MWDLPSWGSSCCCPVQWQNIFLSNVTKFDSYNKFEFVWKAKKKKQHSIESLVQDIARSAITVGGEGLVSSTYWLLLLFWQTTKLSNLSIRGVCLGESLWKIREAIIYLTENYWNSEGKDKWKGNSLKETLQRCPSFLEIPYATGNFIKEESMKHEAWSLCTKGHILS